MTPRRRFPHAAWYSSFLLAAVCGCAAGTPPAHSPDELHNDLVARRAAEIQALNEATGGYLSAAAEQLEAELFLTDAGKVIARAIRAHGGWDAWTALGGLGYSRDRIELGAGGQMVANAQQSPSRFGFLVDAEGRVSAAPGAGDPAELFFTSLPFSLARLEGRKEYLGVEADVELKTRYEKIRCERGRAGAGWVIAYFDYSTYVLRRVLEEKDDGLHLTTFASWIDVAGVKMPTKRSLFRLRSRFQHRDLGRPDEIDVLTDWTGSR